MKSLTAERGGIPGDQRVSREMFSAVLDCMGMEPTESLFVLLNTLESENVETSKVKKVQMLIFEANNQQRKRLFWSGWSNSELAKVKATGSFDRETKAALCVIHQSCGFSHHKTKAHEGLYAT